MHKRWTVSYTHLDVYKRQDHAWLNDMSPAAAKTIKRNVVNLKIEEQTKITQLSAEALLKACAQANKQFDLIYLDPPYAKQQNEALISQICALSLIKPDGLIIIESRKERCV